MCNECRVWVFKSEAPRDGYLSLGCISDRIECALRQVDGIRIFASACIGDGDSDALGVLRVGDMDLFPAERRCGACVSIKSRVYCTDEIAV
jgi:hypothetical protein